MIAKLEGPAVSQYCALRLLQVITVHSCRSRFHFPFALAVKSFYFVIDLIRGFKILQATLDESLYELAGELV